MKLRERIAHIQHGRIAEYKAHRNKVGEKMLRAALRALASIDAADNVNQILERLGLTGTRLDQRDMMVNIDLLIRAEIATILAENSSLSSAAIAEFTRRVVAQTLPTKDDVVIPTAHPVSERRRIDALSDAIKKEMIRQQQKEKP